MPRFNSPWDALVDRIRLLGQTIAQKVSGILTHTEGGVADFIAHVYITCPHWSVQSFSESRVSMTFPSGTTPTYNEYGSGCLCVRTEITQYITSYEGYTR